MKSAESFVSFNILSKYFSTENPFLNYLYAYYLYVDSFDVEISTLPAGRLITLYQLIAGIVENSRPSDSVT